MFSVTNDDGRPACDAAEGTAEGGGAFRSGKDVQRVVDAVTGATWNARNRIMENLFQEDLAANAAVLPAFAPPGQDMEAIKDC